MIKNISFNIDKIYIFDKIYISIKLSGGDVLWKESLWVKT